MQKIIKEVDKAKGIVQVTTPDERWYVKSITDSITGLPGFAYVPSVTWVTSYYPKGIGFMKWLASNGYDEAQVIKQAAGDKGSKVHEAISDLIAGNTVAMDGKYLNKTSGQLEELTVEEYNCLYIFTEWFKVTKPTILANEIPVWNTELNYAGTVDCLAKIDNEFWLIDFKTSKEVWPEYELQVAAYKHALTKNDTPVQVPDNAEWKLGILQVGYSRNKSGWKFTEVDDKFELFLAARKIWENETAGTEPAQKDYPLTLSLGVEAKKEEKEEANKTKKA